MKNRIFIIDDDPDIRRFSTDLLTEEGFMVTSAGKASEGLQKITTNPPDLVLLDVRLPDGNGFEICKKLKADPKTRSIPILMFSSKSDASDVVLGLELGAEDYIRKPFEEREFLARIRIALRRTMTEPESERLTIGPLTIDYARYEATVNGTSLTLTPKEFQLLGYLMKHEGRVVTRPAISESVWGTEYNPSSKTIEFHIDQLRKKLGDNSGWIVVLKGVGYRFEVDA